MKNLFSSICLLCLAAAMQATPVYYEGLLFDLDDAQKKAEVLRRSNIGEEYTREEYFIPNNIFINGVLYTVTDIADNAFYGSPELKEVTIPSSVQHIGDNAFANCLALRTIFLNANASATVSANTFAGTNLNYVVLVVPGEDIAEYQSHPVWGQFGTITEISQFRRPGAAITYSPYAFGIDFSISGDLIGTPGDNIFYDKRNVTLTLKNLQWVASPNEAEVIRFYEGDARIQLRGYNKIVTDHDAIYAEDCKLTIIGPGILDIYATNGIISDNNLVIKDGACVNIYYTNSAIDLHGEELIVNSATLFSQAQTPGSSTQMAMRNVSRLKKGSYTERRWKNVHYDQVNQTMWNDVLDCPDDFHFMEVLSPLPDGILQMTPGGYEFVGQGRGIRISDEYAFSTTREDGSEFTKNLDVTPAWYVLHRGCTEDNFIFTEYATHTGSYSDPLDEYISFKVADDLQKIVSGSLISTQNEEYFIPGDSEGLFHTDIATPATMTIQNGQVVILRGDKKYNLMGAEL